MALRDIPKASELQAFNYAVAGHAGTLCDAKGVLFIKPCVQAEIGFYEQVCDGHSELADLMPLFIGTLMLSNASDAAGDIAKQLPAAADGAVPEEVKEALAEFGQQQQQQPPPKEEQQQPTTVPAVVPSPAAPDAPDASDTPAAPAASPPEVDNVTWIPRGSQSIKTDRAVVLENTTYGYKKPNILDVKLGRRLWADSAPLQKRQRMDEVCTQTTHAKYGFRIAGMRVYQGSDDGSNVAGNLDDDGYRIYDKDYGRKEVNNDNLVDAFRRFLFNPSAGVDAEHSRAIAQAFKTDLERVRNVLERERTRMYSSSLLFVFEGDGEALRAAVEENNAGTSASASDSGGESATETEMNLRVIEADAEYEEPLSTVTVTATAAAESTPTTTPTIVSTTASTTSIVDSANATLRSRSRREILGKVADRSSSRTDSGIAIDDDDDDDDEANVVFAEDDDFSFANDDDDDEVEVDDEAEDEDEDESGMPHVFSLRLIDFAHAKFVPDEEGPDENNLVGVRSLIDIFDELAK